MYESNALAISTQLAATSAQVFDAATIESILSLVSTPNSTAVTVDNLTAANNTTISAGAGVDLVFVATSDTTKTAVTVTGDTPAIFFQGKGGVDATIGTAPASDAAGGASAATVAGETIERVVVGTEGADTITIADGKNTQVIAGDKDTVNAGTGHTLVIAAQGSSTVVGNDKTVVQATGAEADFVVTTADGKATIANAKTGVTVNLTDVNFVQLSGSDALIFADNAKEAAVANLYHALMGRNADAGGLDYWYDLAEGSTLVHTIASGFLESAEYTAKAQTNEQFIEELYQGLFDRDVDAGGEAYWLARLDGGATRADIATEFVEASIDGVDIVGTVTIIDPLA